MATTETYRNCTIEWRHMGEAIGAAIKFSNGHRLTIAEPFGDRPEPNFDDFKSWVRKALDIRPEINSN